MCRATGRFVLTFQFAKTVVLAAKYKADKEKRRAEKEAALEAEKTAREQDDLERVRRLLARKEAGGA